MQDDMVSVIVPIYRAEPLLSTCLDSIVGQTHHNLDIILVDDGSPDRCGAICAAYAARDSRIRVIHQANGGVAAARNTGLRAASGQWIAWVDPDDWVEPVFIQYMLTHAQRAHADLVICGVYEEQRGRRRYFGPGDRLLQRDDALEELVCDRTIHNYLWDKLARAALFQGITFPVGRTFEDVAVLWQVLARAERILCLPGANYHYVIQPTGIVSNSSLENRMNLYRALQERRVRLGQAYPRLRPILEETCVCAAIGIWSGYYQNDRAQRRRWRGELAQIAAFAREHPPGPRVLNSLGPTGRMVLRLVPYDRPWAFALSGLVSRVYRIRHGRSL